MTLKKIKNLTTFVVPATTLAFMFTISFDTDQIFPVMCLLAFASFYFMRCCTSEAELYSFIALIVAVFASFFWRHASLSTIGDCNETTEDKNGHKKRERVLVSRKTVEVQNEEKDTQVQIDSAMSGARDFKNDAIITKSHLEKKGGNGNNSPQIQEADSTIGTLGFKYDGTVSKLHMKQEDRNGKTKLQIEEVDSTTDSPIKRRRPAVVSSSRLTEVFQSENECGTPEYLRLKDWKSSASAQPEIIKFIPDIVARIERDYLKKQAVISSAEYDMCRKSDVASVSKSPLDTTMEFQTGKDELDLHVRPITPNLNGKLEEAESSEDTAAAPRKLTNKEKRLRQQEKLRAFAAAPSNKSLKDTLDYIDNEASVGESQSDISLSENKKKKKDKRKKKGKPMEEDKENMPSTSEKTKVYKTLDEFSDLQMDKEQLYQSLQPYLLSIEDLKRSRYPVPGTLSGEVFVKKDVVQRTCSRCSKVFHVTLEGSCENVEPCIYHLQKPKSINGTFMHGCCGKPLGSVGCQTFASHVCSKPMLHNVNFKNVREKRQVRAEQQSAVYALDCEMVFTNLGFQVAKVGLVNSEGLTIYETFVRPDNEVIDFNTTYSGITANDLKKITTTLSDVQTYLDQLLNKDTILIGHALDGDLKVLRLMHYKIIDTAVVFTRDNGTRPSLKELALQYLNTTIQDNPNGHDCIEDARTCMALMLYKIKKDGLQVCNNIEQPYYSSVYEDGEYYYSWNRPEVPVLLENKYISSMHNQNGVQFYQNNYQLIY